ncbi:hypothetical protein ABK040_006135 [Willaertia magna]
MRVLLLAVFLGLICSVYAQAEHCFDRSFTTGIRTVETKKNLLDNTLMYVDADLQMMRLDIVVRQPGPVNVTVFMDYKAQKRYNAVFVRSDVIGGSLRADLYKESFGGFESRISYAPNTNVPISVVTMGGLENDVTIEDFFNWIHQKPVASVFAIPPACKNLKKMKKSRNVVNTKSITEKVD